MSRRNVEVLVALVLATGMASANNIESYVETAAGPVVLFDIDYCTDPAAMLHTTLGLWRSAFNDSTRRVGCWRDTGAALQLLFDGEIQELPVFSVRTRATCCSL